MGDQPLPAGTQSVNVAVLGLSSWEFPASATGKGKEGIGKSSLCSRFVFPAVDDFAALKEDHSSIVSPEVFNSRELCQTHYLYHGSVVKRRGTNEAVFRVVEHTTFTEESRRPHPGWEAYALRSTSANIPSDGRISYLSMNIRRQNEG